MNTPPNLFIYFLFFKVKFTLIQLDGADFNLWNLFCGNWKGNTAWLDIYFHRKMADVLDIENQDEFEFDEDGDRKLSTNFRLSLLIC